MSAATLVPRPHASASVDAGLASNLSHIADIAARISAPGDLIEEIARCVDERGEVLDSASDALGRISADVARAHGR